MDLAIAAAVFPIIFIGELPDKTMFATLVLSTKGRALAVWAGSAAAFLVHVVIATTIGVALFKLLPHRVVDGIVAVLFLLGSAYSAREATKTVEEAREEAAEEVAADTANGVRSNGRRAALTAFLVIFLAEWGDLTQILTANLAAHYHAPLSVGVGSTTALWAVAALAVLGGNGLLRFVKIRTLRIVTAVVLVGLAGYSAWQALR